MTRLLRLVAAPFASLLAGCAVHTPWRSVAEPMPGSPLVVSVTQARVEPSRRAEFDRYVESVVDALPRQPGLVGYSIRRELLGDGVWTLTAWRDEASRLAFVASRPHAEAMARALPALRSARFARVEVVDTRGVPRWDEALGWLAGRGRDYPLPATP